MLPVLSDLVVDRGEQLSSPALVQILAFIVTFLPAAFQPELLDVSGFGDLVEALLGERDEGFVARDGGGKISLDVRGREAYSSL